MPQPSPTLPCPCGAVSPRGKPLAYADCCGRYVEHFDTTPAPDAERLMRPRHSASVLQRREHLLAPWHASQRPSTLASAPGAHTLGLTVPCHRPRTA
mgnify:CR=1 FL=1